MALDNFAGCLYDAPMLTDITILAGILLGFIFLSVCAGGAIFYAAFRLGLVHGGVVARMGGSQLALTGTRVGSKEEKQDGVSTIANKDQSPFAMPSFGELVRENSSK